jgi:hypothetical protein
MRDRSDEYREVGHRHPERRGRSEPVEAARPDGGGMSARWLLRLRHQRDRRKAEVEGRPNPRAGLEHDRRRAS